MTSFRINISHVEASPATSTSINVSSSPLPRCDSVSSLLSRGRGIPCDLFFFACNVELQPAPHLNCSCRQHPDQFALLPNWSISARQRSQRKICKFWHPYPSTHHVEGRLCNRFPG